MALDVYSLCPCGSGKKMKFCCSDLIGEMEKIRRMLEGEQFAACLKHVERLLEKEPQRASLLGLQAMLQQRLDRLDDAEQTVQRFLAHHPGNPVALGELATIAARKQGGKAAVGLLQDALEAIKRTLPHRVYEAVGVVGHALFHQGEFLAGRRHLLLQAAVGPDDDERAVSVLIQLNESSAVPLLLKQAWSLWPCPEDAAWKDNFDEALLLGQTGQWRKAAGQFADLVEPSGDDPAVWRNLGLCRGWIADRAGCVEALHKFATLDIPLDDAVEAEALAQLLEPDNEEDRVDLVQRVFPLSDESAAGESLQSSKRCSALQINTEQQNASEAPPPRAGYMLLDREMPATGAGLKKEEVPCGVGRAFVFGRETDRPPRIEMVAYRPQLDEAEACLREVIGEALRQPETDQDTVVGSTSLAEYRMSWSWRFPADSDREFVRQLTIERKNELIFEKWPQLPLLSLGGKPPAEAAASDEGRIPALAAIFLMELMTSPGEANFDRLRQQLGLPRQELIDPTEVEGSPLTVTRLSRVMVDKLTDEQLIECYERAAASHADEAIVHLGMELVSRGSVDEQIDRAAVYGQIADLQPTPERSLEYIDKARQACRESGEPAASWDLEALQLCIATANGRRVVELIRQIQTEHANEPGVSYQLYQILLAAGLINQDGTLRQQPVQQEPMLVTPGSTSNEAGEIWTPEAGEPAEKSKIWTPDSD